MRRGSPRRHERLFVCLLVVDVLQSCPAQPAVVVREQPEALPEVAVNLLPVARLEQVDVVDDLLARLSPTALAAPPFAPWARLCDAAPRPRTSNPGFSSLPARTALVAVRHSGSDASCLCSESCL